MTTKIKFIISRRQWRTGQNTRPSTTTWTVLLVCKAGRDGTETSHTYSPVVFSVAFIRCNVFPLPTCCPSYTYTHTQWTCISYCYDDSCLQKKCLPLLDLKVITQIESILQPTLLSQFLIFWPSVFARTHNYWLTNVWKLPDQSWHRVKCIGLSGGNQLR